MATTHSEANSWELEVEALQADHAAKKADVNTAEARLAQDKLNVEYWQDILSQRKRDFSLGAQQREYQAAALLRAACVYRNNTECRVKLARLHLELVERRLQADKKNSKASGWSLSDVKDGETSAEADTKRE